MTVRKICHIRLSRLLFSTARLIKKINNSNNTAIVRLNSAPNSISCTVYPNRRFIISFTDKPDNQEYSQPISYGGCKIDLNQRIIIQAPYRDKPANIIRLPAVISNFFFSSANDSILKIVLLRFAVINQKGCCFHRQR